MLEGSEEGIELRQCGPVGGFQLLYGSDPASEFLLNGEGRKKHFNSNHPL